MPQDVRHIRRAPDARGPQRDRQLRNTLSLQEKEGKERGVISHLHAPNIASSHLLGGVARAARDRSGPV